MKDVLVVAQVMSKNPVGVSPDAFLSECARLMLKRRVGSLLVQEQGVLRGIVTEKDFVAASHAGINPKTAKVKDVMEYVVITITPEKSILEAVKIMAKYEVRRLPVVSEEEKLVGLITMNDILKVQPHLFEEFVWKTGEGKSVPAHDGECEHCGSFTMVHLGDEGWLCEDCRD